MTFSCARTTSAITRRALLAVAPHVARAQKSDRVVFGTNWRAQGEHGGFYHAVATGIYRPHGLDVTLRPGGRARKQTPPAPAPPPASTSTGARASSAPSTTWRAESPSSQWPPSSRRI